MARVKIAPTLSLLSPRRVNCQRMGAAHVMIRMAGVLLAAATTTTQHADRACPSSDLIFGERPIDGLSATK